MEGQRTRTTHAISRPEALRMALRWVSGRQAEQLDWRQVSFWKPMSSGVWTWNIPSGYVT